jgi:Zn-dependent M28 family amino/carboxypeptidase
MSLSLRDVRSPLLAIAAALLLAAACSNGQGTTPGTGSGRLPDAAIDSARLMADLRLLADDSMRGRRTGTPENAAARRFIAQRFAALGLATATGSDTGRLQSFTVRNPEGATITGVNVIGAVRGRTTPDRYIVVTAHYDHVGVGRAVNGDSIYNGADDNASGTAALLALAEHFARQPARHSLLFVALDAEEMGLRGARAFVATPPVPRAAIVLNVNMDMVSLSAKGELYAAGAAKWPALRPALDRVAARAPVRLILGHDTPVPTAQDDWTLQSDQGAFHEAGIAFVYFGVEDHPHYHRPSDEPRNVTTAFYVNAVRTVLDAIRELDGLP